ncbi:FAD-dependent monooxygenase [Micromonospora sp. WMMD1102]|uniref:FAD-dependent oxidoreductase n=1 Tax=Micromonospora sp. WMMD1102 TaxID=3016105 RepID=UPI0024158073|nr:FAD-dependent monooxygenase [Micromonospora sp. WMMD1102]MDG4790149.1 FAD-dependent monooxygenase [Micromonospora sp. WMMD1102]
MPVNTPRRAVVAGAGLAGTLAAAVLAEDGYAVTVIERDRLPTGPAARKGVPQARHAHLLWSGGARTLDSLLPGTTDRLLAAGAHRIGVPSMLVSMSAQGWFQRHPDGRQFLITCSRDLLDWVIRDQALSAGDIDVRDTTDVLELLGDATRLTGVRIRDQQTQIIEDLHAEFVVDATGRGSHAPEWLTRLGLPAVREEIVDSGLAYATRLFRAPATATHSFPVVNVQADPREPRPGQTATLLPIEGDRWLVTLSGTRGGEPTTDEDRFVEFARRVRHPIVGDLIASAQPSGPVIGSRSTVNRRRYYERLPRWPHGLAVLGDAVATFNPIYGHGMSVAAHGVAALRDGLRKHHHDPQAAQKIQQVIARTVEPAWLMATGQDILYPSAIGRRPPAAARLAQRYFERMMRTGISRRAVAYALLDVFSLSASMRSLLSPRIVLETILGPKRPPPSEPPLTAEELSV